MRQAGVVQTAREMLGVTAVPLIEAYHIPAGRPRLVGNAGDVVGLTRTFQAMQQEKRRVLVALVVPVAMRKHARVGRHIEVALTGRRQPLEPARLRPRVEGLQMTAGESRLVFAGFE